MMALARLPRDGYFGTQRIAEEVNVPPSYLSKLLQILSRAGLVETRRGIAGGIRLARDPDSISLYDIVASLESLERWSECLLGDASCSDNSACAIHERWKQVREAYLEMLRRSPLSELANCESAIERSGRLRR